VHFELGLRQSFLHKHVEHGFDFLIKVEQFMVTIVDLGALANVFGRHARVEEGLRRAVQIKLGGDADVCLLWLVLKLLDVGVRLDRVVPSPEDGLSRRNISVGVLLGLALRWGGGARRSVATCVAHRFALVPRGTRVLLGVLAGRDNHGRVGIASLHTLVVRDVLGIVLIRVLAVRVLKPILGNYLGPG